MNKVSLLVAGLVFGLLSFNSFAESVPSPTPTTTTTTTTPTTSTPATSTAVSAVKKPDCSQARNVQLCEARVVAREACKGKKGAEFRHCVREAMPAPDCSKAKNPQRCEERQAARNACKDKTGIEHKHCMGEQKQIEKPSVK